MKKFTEAEIRAQLQILRECSLYESCGECPNAPAKGKCVYSTLEDAQKRLAAIIGQLLEEREEPKGTAPIRLFVSQPMSGRGEEEIRAKRAEAVRFVRKMTRCDVELLDSDFPGLEPSATVVQAVGSACRTKGRPLQHLARSLALLAEADLAYFAEGWQDARGCRIEKACADEYGIDHIVCEGSDGR